MSRKTDEPEFETTEPYAVPNETPLFCAIEDHARELKISAPVFAAVKQYKGWAAGKKVPKNEFENAVNGFLNSSMGGK